jgi:hypothetical protein
MAIEAEDRLLVFHRQALITESPAPAGMMDEVAVCFLAAGPETAYGAGIPMLLPALQIQMPVLSQRRDATSS